MAKKDFCIESQEIGDIILISNKACLSKIQRCLQTLGSLKISKYSHAILALSQGIYIEAMKDNNKNDKYDIDIFCINELKKRFESDYYDNWKVIRYKKIDSTIQNKIFENANYFYGQKYNSNPIGKVFKHKYKINSSYCSELVQRIYEKAGIILDYCERDFWPVHLERLTKRHKDDWEDVTSLYDKKCSNFHDDNFYNDLCNDHRKLKNYIFLNYKKHLEICENINDMKKFMNSVTTNMENFPQNELEELSKSYSIAPTFHNQFIKPIINEYSIIEYNNKSKNDKFPENTSYLLENIKHVDLNKDLKIYDEYIEKELKSSFSCISTLTDYINLLIINNSENYNLKEQLNILINTFPIYSEDELSEALASILSFKNKYNNYEINQYYKMIKTLINYYRLINLYVDSGILSIDNKIDKNILLNIKDKVENFIEKEFNGN